MAALPPYRELAGQALAQAAVEINSIPSGRVATDVMAAHSAKAQAVATIAAAQALLEIGDVLRDTLGQSEPHKAVDG